MGLKNEIEFLGKVKKEYNQMECRGRGELDELEYGTRMARVERINTDFFCYAEMR